MHRSATCAVPKHRITTLGQRLLVLGLLALLTLGAAAASLLPAASALVGTHAAGQPASQQHWLAPGDPPVITR